MREFAVSALRCRSVLDFSFYPAPVDLHFLMPARDGLEAKAKVGEALLEEGLVADRLVKTAGPPA